jgi:hypothetical protein
MATVPEPQNAPLPVSAPARAEAPGPETSKEPRPIKLYRGYLRVMPRSVETPGGHATPAS